MSPPHAVDTAPSARPWHLFRSLAGYAPRYLSGDLIAALTLAAITIPEQMATARLGGFGPEIGFFAFVAGAVAFAAFGANRFLSAGADSTITPIFAGGLAALGTMEAHHYGALAAALALLVGIVLICGGLFRLGWIADLLSMPVMTGFLAGISVHIIVSQLPELLGITVARAPLTREIGTIVSMLDRTNLLCLGLGLGVFLVTTVSERISPKIPGALIGLAGATAAVAFFGLEQRGVAVLGTVKSGLPSVFAGPVEFREVLHLLPLSLIVGLVVMVQTAATTRAFAGGPDSPPPDVNQDFIGVGVGSVLAGLISAFPVNASPPRTAIVAETGGRSQLAGLAAAAIVLGLAMFGASLLAHVPFAALAGILLFVALRIIRVPAIVDIYRQSVPEFLLIAVTMIAIVVLPIEIGVALGIVLSLMHGIWTTTRAQAIAFERVPGTSIWWPRCHALEGETEPGVVVLAFQAPLSFLNAYDFKHGIEALADRTEGLRLVVLEAADIVAIDYTAAKILEALIRHFHAEGVGFAVCRLESVRAQAAFERFGLMALLGEDSFFRSAEEAVRNFVGKSGKPAP